MMVRPVTQNLLDSVMLDVWPGPAAICDFGIDSQEHYEALYYPIREGEITPEQLDKALGCGSALTSMVKYCKSNPHKSTVFKTAYDFLEEKE